MDRKETIKFLILSLSYFIIGASSLKESILVTLSNFLYLCTRKHVFFFLEVRRRVTQPSLKRSKSDKDDALIIK